MRYDLSQTVITFLHHNSKRLQHFGSLVLVVSALIFMGCEQMASNRATASTPSQTAAQNGKIPVTTSSEEARKEFLAGRDLAEKLRITDSIPHFDKALSLDPSLALAELSRANVSPMAKEFFEHLKKAVNSIVPSSTRPYRISERSFT